jgi:hypothetical protein
LDIFHFLQLRQCAYQRIEVHGQKNTGFAESAQEFRNRSKPDNKSTKKEKQKLNRQVKQTKATKVSGIKMNSDGDSSNNNKIITTTTTRQLNHKIKSGQGRG